MHFIRKEKVPSGNKINESPSSPDNVVDWIFLYFTKETEAFWIPQILKDKIPEHKAIKKEIIKTCLRKKVWVLAILQKTRCLSETWKITMTAHGLPEPFRILT